MEISLLGLRLRTGCAGRLLLKEVFGSLCRISCVKGKGIDACMLRTLILFGYGRHYRHSVMLFIFSGAVI